MLDPRVDGDLALSHFESQGEDWDQLRGRVALSSGSAQFTGLTLDQASLHANGSGMIPLMDWIIDQRRPFHVEGQFRGADVVDLAHHFSKLKLPVIRGIASGSGSIAGTIENPSGNAK